MNIYILNYFSIFFVGAFYWIAYPKYKVNFIWIAFFQLFLISGFRSENIGVDTKNYLIIFRDMVNLPLEYALTEYNLEYGYIFFNKFLSFFVSDEQWILLTTSFLIIYGFFIFFLKSNSLFFSLMLFISMGYFNYSLNLVRQFIAMMVVCNAYYYLGKNNKMYIVMILIAVSFHATAGVFIVLYILSKVKNRLFGILILFFMSLLIFAIFPYIIEEVLLIYPKYMTYLYSDYFNQINLSTGCFYFSKLLIQIFLCIVTAIKCYSEKLSFKKDKYYYFHIILLFSVFVNLLAVEINIFNRYSYYFSVFMCIIIPDLVDEIKNKVLKYFVCLIVLLFFFYCIYIFILWVFVQ